MHLKQVIFRNFRCFDTFTLPLDPRLNVLVADNGGGKSAVLDGIAIGLSPVLRYLSSADQRLSGPGIEDRDFRRFWYSTENDHPQQQTSTYAQICLETTAGLRWDTWRPSAAGHKPPEVCGQQALSAHFGGVLASQNTTTAIVPPVFAYYNTRRGWLDLPDRIRKTNIDYSQPIAALVDSLTASGNFRELVKWFDLADADERRNSQPTLFDTETDALIRENRYSLTPIRSAIHTVLEGNYDDLHFQGRKLLIRSTSTGLWLQLDQLSQGYQSMLAIAMDFSRRLMIAHSQQRTAVEPLEHPAIMLIDEVDMHLHPTWQQRVLPTLMNTFPNTQFIVSTHSAPILNTVRKENIWCLTCDEQQQFNIQHPEFSPLGQDAGSALAFVLGAHASPELPITEKVHTYEQLARAGEIHSETAQKIKQELDEAGFEFSDARQSMLKFLSDRAQKRTQP